MTTEERQATASGSVPPRWLLKAMTRIHVLLHRVSGGRLFNQMAGNDVCFVTMTGAKTGRRRTIPLMYVPHGENLLLVASQGGAPTHPLWYHNLVANPDIEITHRGQRRTMRARLADAEERPRLWRVCDEHYPPYASYRARTTREIPIFVCEPR